jgi:hypothetical protein
MRRRLVGLLVLAGAMLALYLYLGPKMPKDQVIHLVLGDAAPTVTEVAVRYRPTAVSGVSPDAGNAEWSREVTFEYAKGAAPRVVTHQARLPDGDYLVEIEVVHDSARAVTTRVVRLGGTTSIELSRALAPSP